MAQIVRRVLGMGFELIPLLNAITRAAPISAPTVISPSIPKTANASGSVSTSSRETPDAIPPVSAMG